MGKYDDRPVRDTYDTDEEFEQAMAEWEEAQRGPFPDRVVPEQDLYTGPDFDEELKNRDNVFPDRDVPTQDLYTGPDFDEELKNRDKVFPDRDVPTEDLHTGPGVANSNYVDAGPGVKGSGYVDAGPGVVKK